MRTTLLSLAAIAVQMMVPMAAKAVVVDGPDIIPAPSSTEDSAPGAENQGQQAFDERQCVKLTAPLDVDEGGLMGGTTVDSHMIFLNPIDNIEVTETTTWTFSTPIIATISDMNGDLEAASNDLLGAPGTFYPGSFFGRGMDIGLGDSFTVDGSEIEVTMKASAPGDWMRVLTEAGCDGAATWGDDDCNGAVNAVDALKNLQDLAAIPYTQTEPCFTLGEVLGVSPAGYGDYAWGDVDCNGALAATDALAILRSIAALPVSQDPACPEIGEGVLLFFGDG